MLAFFITIALIFAGLIAVLSLTDTWLKARAAFWSLFEERELLDAGFVPQVEAEELRVRRPLHKTVRRSPNQRRQPNRQRRSGFGGSARSQLGAVQSLG